MSARPSASALGAVERFLDARQLFGGQRIGGAAALDFGEALVVRFLEGVECFEEFFESARGFPARPFRFEGSRIGHGVVLLGC